MRVVMRRRTRAVAARAFVLLLALPTVLLAHSMLKRSSPAGGAHLTAAPRELRLDFTEAPS